MVDQGIDHPSIEDNISAALCLLAQDGDVDRQDFLSSQGISHEDGVFSMMDMTL